MIAVERITFGQSLTKICKVHIDPEIRKLALGRVTFKPTLKEVFAKDEDAELRAMTNRQLARIDKIGN